MESANKAQTLAIRMYAQGKTKQEVIEMLRAENFIDEISEQLASEYHRDYEDLRREQRRKLKKAVESDKLIGFLSLSVGIFGTLLTYILIDGFFILLWGVILAGVVFLIKSLINQKEVAEIEKELKK